uniref:hypothetical protein n=1 Tax=Paracoccus sp. TRP TaxID=412597 RepID=UPI000225F658|nr:hypothetical protein [Paracoccus sp. TRP]
MTDFDRFQRPDYDDGGSLATMIVLSIVAAIFLAIGVFIGWLVYAPQANALPAPCADYRAECAAVMSEGW